MGASPGVTVWQAMHPCRWKSRSPRFGSPFSVTAAARTDSKGIDAIVGPRPAPPASRSRSSRGREGRRRLHLGALVLQAVPDLERILHRIGPADRPQQAGGRSRRLPRRLDRPFRLGLRPRRCPGVGVQREQDGIAQLASRRVFVLRPASGSRRRAARGRRRGGSPSTRRAVPAGANPGGRSPPARGSPTR